MLEKLSTDILSQHIFPLCSSVTLSSLFLTCHTLEAAISIYGNNEFGIPLWDSLSKKEREKLYKASGEHLRQNIFKIGQKYFKLELGERKKSFFKCRLGSELPEYDHSKDIMQSMQTIGSTGADITGPFDFVREEVFYTYWLLNGRAFAINEDDESEYTLCENVAMAQVVRPNSLLYLKDQNLASIKEENENVKLSQSKQVLTEKFIKCSPGALGFPVYLLNENYQLCRLEKSLKIRVCKEIKLPVVDVLLEVFGRGLCVLTMYNDLYYEKNYDHPEGFKLFHSKCVNIKIGCFMKLSSECLQTTNGIVITTENLNKYFFSKGEFVLITDDDFKKDFKAKAALK